MHSSFLLEWAIFEAFLSLTGLMINLCACAFFVLFFLSLLFDFVAFLPALFSLVNVNLFCYSFIVFSLTSSTLIPHPSIIFSFSPFHCFFFLSPQHFSFLYPQHFSSQFFLYILLFCPFFSIFYFHFSIFWTI